MTWLSGYKNRIKLTIDQTKVDATLTNFPLMVKLSASSGVTTKNVSNIFDSLGSYDNRKKISVRTDDNTQCYVEIQNWDHANKTAWLWVRVPSVSATVDTILYLYYDKNRADNSTYVGDTTSTPAKTVWDSNYKIVTHLEQDPSGTAPQILDSTSNVKNGTSAGTMTTSDLVSAKINKGLDFDGTNDAIAFGNAFTSDVLTIEAIFKADNVTPSDVGKGIVVKSDTGGHDWSLTIGTDSKLHFGAYNVTPAVILNIAGATTLVTGTYYHVLAVAMGNGQSGYIYLNGVQDGTGSQTGTIRNTKNIYIGAYAGDVDRYFDGIVDNVKMLNIAKNSAYAKASYNSSWDTLVTYSAQFVGCQYVGNDILDVFKTQYIRNSIGDGLNQYIKNSLGDGSTQYIKAPLVPHYNHYIRNTLSGHINKAHFIRNSISEGFNKTQYIRNRLETFSVLTQHYIRHSLADREVLRPTHDFDVLIDGVSMKGYIDNVKIGISEDNPINDVSISFLNLSEFNRCDISKNYGTERIEVSIDNETYRFLIEDRTKTEQFGDSKFSIWGRQITAKLGEGFADPSTITYQNKMASVIASELAGDISVIWIATDYFISDFSFEGLPIDGLKLLASGIGAIVRTMLNGSLMIRKKLLFRPKDLEGLSANFTFTDANIISRSFSEVAAEFNAVTVEISVPKNNVTFDIDIETSCAMPGETVSAKVYSSKPSVEYRYCLTEGTATKAGSGIEETLEETINITDGRGTVSKPIFSIEESNISKCNYSGNPDLKFTAGTKEIQIDNVEHGTLIIKYITKHDKWLITSNLPGNVSFSVTPLNSTITKVNLVTGNGNKSADNITHPYISSQSQAREVGETFLDDKSNKKQKYNINTIFLAAHDGDIGAIEGNEQTPNSKGYIKSANITISVSNNVPIISQDIEIISYVKDFRL